MWSLGGLLHRSRDQGMIHIRRKWAVRALVGVMLIALLGE
jgi:hypothetical protein